ncbi:hypothetical protein NQ152_00465 [Microbacterium sp. zg.B48]|uniref:hypothetical protein n=1 Tax=Microbacterium sp. zg.B48 TaxID=2969408 RepID=UPI00214BEFA0|nr:hypothetical protein [Microbacterium sp. zg.B48]MCR2761971.1 hypothetical protein [Microbacterium sp. zg.B48]
MNDYGPGVAAGFAFIVLGIVLYLGTIALVLWIGYLIMRTAVKNGILLADAERGRPTLGGGPGPSAPAGWYDSSQGRRYWNGQQWTTPPPVPGR